MVYVISKGGNPLMPCSNAIARILLKENKAKVKYRTPFTIKLNYETTNYTQELSLGIDTGSDKLAASVTTIDDDIKKVLYKSEVEIRNDITAKMTQRSKYRRNRRSRKTRYRAPRFLNRENSTRTDRFNLTITSKISGHIREIEFIKKNLPITKMVLECGQFDMYLMKNPVLANPKVRHWGYQKGPNYGFANTKAMVLNRDGYTCQCCKKKIGRMEVHHIVYQSNGGSDEAENLITVCPKCHKEIHDGVRTLGHRGKKKGQLKHATQMNSIRKQLLRRCPDAEETFGYVTKENRQLLGLNKEHCIDACVISAGGEPFVDNDILYVKKCVADGDYQHYKGQHSEKKIDIGKIKGFRKFDKVEYFGKEYLIKGRMSTGYAILMDFDGNKVNFNSFPKGFKTPKMSNLRRVQARCSCMTTEIRHNVTIDAEDIQNIA